MSILQNILKPSMECTQQSSYEAISYVNTLPHNLVMQSLLILIPLLLWFLIGLGTGGTRKMRLTRPNYYIFLILILLQVLLLMLYDFPIYLKWFS